MQLESLISAVTSWAESRPDIVGLALAGSHARGAARPDSDIDLIVLCKSPDSLMDGDWPAHFGEVVSSAIEHYGAVTSRRMFYTSGLEVEFGVAAPSWADIPLDAGTRDVLASGCRVLYDPEQRLHEAVRVANKD